VIKACVTFFNPESEFLFGSQQVDSSWQQSIDRRRPCLMKWSLSSVSYFSRITCYQSH